MKYSYEYRLLVVKSIKEDHLSNCEASRLYGPHEKDIRSWLRRYELHGEEGLRFRNGTYSVDFKLIVIRDMRENYLSLFDTAAKYCIPSDSTLPMGAHLRSLRSGRIFPRQSRL